MIRLLLFGFVVTYLPAQTVPNRTSAWWKHCGWDARYDKAASQTGQGWNLVDVRKLADGGDACMQYVLGHIFDGLEPVTTRVETDWKQAAKWYELSARQGNAEAQSGLAGKYWMGLGMRQDYVEAMQWYKKAADQGDSCSQLQLGEMYRDAQGTAKDLVQAHKWFNLAAADSLGLEFNGSYCLTQAARDRNDLANMMTAAQIAEAQRLARTWMPHVAPDPRAAIVKERH